MEYIYQFIKKIRVKFKNKKNRSKLKNYQEKWKKPTVNYICGIISFVFKVMCTGKGQRTN